MAWCKGLLCQVLYADKIVFSAFIVEQQGEFGTLVGVGDNDLWTHHIKVWCIQRIEQGIHTLLKYGFENLDHIVRDKADEAVNERKSNLLRLFSVGYLIDGGIVVFEECKRILLHYFGMTVCIMIIGDLVLVGDALHSADGDKREVALTGIDHAFKQHGDIVRKEGFDLSVESDRGKLIKEDTFVHDATLYLVKTNASLVMRSLMRTIALSASALLRYGPMRTFFMPR